MFARSSWVTRSLTAKECTSSFCENVVTVSHLKRLMKAILAGLWEESGITVRKKKGNSSRSLSAGAVDPNDTLRAHKHESKQESSEWQVLIVYCHTQLYLNYVPEGDDASEYFRHLGARWSQEHHHFRLVLRVNGVKESIDSDSRIALYKQFSVWDFPRAWKNKGREELLIYFTTIS